MQSSALIVLKVLVECISDGEIWYSAELLGFLESNRLLEGKLSHVILFTTSRYPENLLCLYRKNRSSFFFSLFFLPLPLIFESIMKVS